MACAGQYIYKYWTDFTVDDIQKQVDIYDIYWILTSPRIDMKPKSNNADQVNGNKICNKNIWSLIYQSTSEKGKI